MRPAARGREPGVLGDREVVVTERLVPDEADRPPRRLAVAREIDAEHGSLARAQRQQPGAETQERGLARTVRAAQQHDLAGVDVEIGAGERGEPPEHADG